MLVQGAILEKSIFDTDNQHRKKMYLQYRYKVQNRNWFPIWKLNAVSSILRYVTETTNINKASNMTS